MLRQYVFGLMGFQEEVLYKILKSKGKNAIDIVHSAPRLPDATYKSQAFSFIMPAVKKSDPLGHIIN
jgi:hypothetical protein